MALTNSWYFVKNIVDGQKMLDCFENKFRLVAQRPYEDKKGVLPSGVTVTLMVLKDSADYGVDKKTGRERDNNIYQTFDATILNGTQELPSEFTKGKIVRLVNFREDCSYSIGFDLLLRFDDIELVEVKS